MSTVTNQDSRKQAAHACFIVRRSAEISEELQSSDLHPLLKKIYANRGITRLSQVSYQLTDLLDYSLLKNIDIAAKIVADTVMQQQRILVVGDFDADGATASAVVLRSLKAFGLFNVDYLVPNRFHFGYGLSPELVEFAANLPVKPELIITVDNGISSLGGVKRANELDIAVVITDHHLAGDSLPQAAAIVNPNQPGCEFPGKNIAGVGVAFYLMLAVRAALREHNWFDGDRPEPNMANYLDLVALGTVADVVPLDDNNRVLIESGLQRVRRNKGCAGINALLTIAGKSIEACSSQDFGFVVGPRLNAAGRLDDMSVGIECLLSDDYEQALQYASTLNQMNLERRQIEGDMLDQASVLLEEEIRQLASGETMPVALALYDQQWHQGVVGLLASRIKEKFHRPVIAFADAGNGEIKGSGRSIAGLHMRDVLDAISKQRVELIDKFGGHAMAAGLTIRQDKFEQFKQAFEKQVSLLLQPEDLNNIRETDGSIASRYLTIETSEQLKFAGPWGQQFPEPVFDDVFKVLNWRIVGEKHLKLELAKADTGECFEAIAFNKTNEDLPAGENDIRIVYRLDVNEFRGNRKLQLIVQHIEAV
ncbi:MAG: single-stranded-DNA-specific exonuclease RecJ [Gammaproteobacteria bacterium]|nr:single-stranded-DNA-specific exonuclease RecJ [Gammaproteobacteria bacterium]